MYRTWTGSFVATIVGLAAHPAVMTPRPFVTGSAKTGHNRTSLNMQYKALNTLGAYLRIVKKR